MLSKNEQRRLIITSFWVVIIAGLPLWWKTTEVYRAQLPFAEIEAWSNWEASKLDFPTLFTLQIAPIGSLNESKNLAISLKKSLNSMPSINIVDVSWDDWERWNKHQIDIDSLKPRSKLTNGHYDLYIMPHETTKVYIGNYRQALLQVETEQWNSHAIYNILLRLIQSLFSEEQATIKQTIFEQSPEAKVDLSNMRTMKYSPRYQLTFSLMNGDPSTLLVDWEIEDAVSAYLKPFIDELSVISNFTIDSQIQHYAAFTFEPRKTTDGEGNNMTAEPYFYLTPDSLPHFINSAEWNLASAVSSYPTLNFILYVPSRKQSPLRIHDSKGQPTENNAFLIPRWGGIVINNPSPKNATYTFTFDDLKPIMEIFVSQLRGLLGVRELKSSFLYGNPIEIKYPTPPNTAITLWEFDSLVRKRIAENIVATVATLKSLSQLVSEIPNMVVLDHIQTEVLHALGSLKKSCDSLQSMKYDLALEYSKHAIIRSEAAFFDPTMVSMLYFPDEHKYAIYMPLFVPISVPLLVALLREIRDLKTKRENGAKEIDNAVRS